MSLFDLFTVLKGSSLSGNYGHAGRPGIFGGSASGGGHRAIGLDKLEDKRTALEDYKKNKKGILGAHTDFYNKEWTWQNKLHDRPSEKLAEWLDVDIDAAKALVGKAFSYHDEETGYSSIIYSFNINWQNPEEIKVAGDIYSKDGDELGYFERTFYPDKSVHHDYFQLRESENQGSGFGSRFYEHAERTYKQAGIQQVHLNANITVGGYAWARMGFDFQTSGDRRFVTTRLKRRYSDRYGVDLDETKIPQHAYQIALMTGPDGHRIGKEAMLGSDWFGVKNLDTKDPGYRVGQAYYKTKKSKK